MDKKPVDIKTFWVKYSIPSGIRNKIILCDTQDEAKSIVSDEERCDVQYISIKEIEMLGDSDYGIVEWRTSSEPRVIYIKPEDVPVCLVEKDSGWKPPQGCHTRYGVVDDPFELKHMYERYKRDKHEC